MNDLLSTRLSQCTIEEARPLLEALWLAQPKPAGGCPRKGANKFLSLLNIGPEGYLSAVMMLLSEDTEYAIYTIQYNNKGAPAAWTEESGEVVHTHPALALAAAIAKDLEAQSGATTREGEE